MVEKDVVSRYLRRKYTGPPNQNTADEAARRQEESKRFYKPSEKYQRPDSNEKK